MQAGIHHPWAAACSQRGLLMSRAWFSFTFLLLRKGFGVPGWWGDFSPLPKHSYLLPRALVYPSCLPSMGAPGDMVGFGGEESSFPATGSLCIHRDSSPLGSAQGAWSREGMLGWRVGRMLSPVRPSPAFPAWEKAVPALCWQQCPCLSLSVSLTLAFPRTFLAPAFPSSPP